MVLDAVAPDRLVLAERLAVDRVPEHGPILDWFDFEPMQDFNLVFEGITCYVGEDDEGAFESNGKKFWVCPPRSRF